MRTASFHSNRRNNRRDRFIKSLLRHTIRDPDLSYRCTSKEGGGDRSAKIIDGNKQKKKVFFQTLLQTKQYDRQNMYTGLPVLLYRTCWYLLVLIYDTRYQVRITSNHYIKSYHTGNNMELVGLDLLPINN